MIAIIGGGISGLSLAHFLAKQGRAVTVFEKEEHLGGTCRCIALGDRVVDVFYHVLNGGENQLVDLIRDLKLERAVFPVRITQGFFQAGRMYSASSAKDLMLFSALSPGDRLRLGLTVARAGLTNDWRSLDSRSAEDWLIEAGGRNLYQQFWRPIMACKFGQDVSRVSAADIWFRICRLGKVTLPRKGSGAFYLKGTLRTLFDALEESLNSLGARVLKMTSVKRLIVERERVKSVEMESGTSFDVDAVVSTVPLPDLVRMLPDDMKAYRDQLMRIEYLHNVCLILKTAKPISPYYQLNLGDADMPYTGVISADCFYPPREYGGYVTYFTRYFTKREYLFAKSAEELLREYAPYIQRIQPDFEPDGVLAMAVSKGRNVEPLHTIGYAQRIPPEKSPVKGLHILSTAQIYPQPTVLEVAVAGALRMADHWSQ